MIQICAPASCRFEPLDLEFYEGHCVNERLGRAAKGLVFGWILEGVGPVECREGTTPARRCGLLSI